MSDFATHQQLILRVPEPLVALLNENKKEEEVIQIEPDLGNNKTN
jgi:hypothetical protein